MCKKAINTISPALETITEADNLLKVKNVLALFIQTVDVSNIMFSLQEICSYSNFACVRAGGIP